MTAGRTLSSLVRVILLCIQGFAEHKSLPTDDPIEDFSEEDMATGKYGGGWELPTYILVRDRRRIVWDIADLLDRAADRFSACMLNSMMDRLEKRIDEKIDSKLGPVMERLSVLEKTSSSSRSGPSLLSDNGGSTDHSSATGVDPAVFTPYLEQGVVRISRQKHMV